MLELEIHQELFYMKHQSYFYVKDAGQKKWNKEKRRAGIQFWLEVQVNLAISKAKVMNVSKAKKEKKRKRKN